MINVLPVFIKSCNRIDISRFTLCDCFLIALAISMARCPFFQFIFFGRFPQRMKIAHGHAPVSHGTSRIFGDHIGKSFFGFIVFKRMQDGDRLVEFFFISGFVDTMKFTEPKLAISGPHQIRLPFLRFIASIISAVGALSAELQEQISTAHVANIVFLMAVNFI